MLLAYSYEVNKVVIGQNPYPDSIVPYLGSAYSQTLSSKNTPTTTAVALHFRMHRQGMIEDVADMIRNNWVLLPHGYLFINVKYNNNSDATNPVDLMQMYDRTSEYVVSVVLNSQMNYGTRSVQILALGVPAQHCANHIAGRLTGNDMDIRIMNERQPSMLSRLTYDKDLIGINPNYSCLSASAMKFIGSATESYMAYQGMSNEERQGSIMSSTGDKTIQSILAQSIAAIAEELNTLINSAPDIDNNS